MHVPASRGLLLLALLTGTPGARSAAPPAPDPGAAPRAVLTRHCASCHGSQAKPKGGLGQVSDLQRLISLGQVVPGLPARSPVYQRIAEGEMPPPGKPHAFTAADREILRRWIAAGAPVATAEPRTLGESELRRLVRADLETIAVRERRFVRYLSLAHLASRPLVERLTLRHAVSKLVNSLSWHPRLTAPLPLADGLVVRIDLRHHRWTERQWDRLTARYPYAPPEDTERLIVRADWFVATASRPPFYHDLLALPGSDRALERLLQVDVASNLDDRTAVRAGFNGSGVARANRVLERHDALHGAYWRSYDFSDNTGRQNVFEHPLGPAPGPASFRHAGSEMIFHLPNGLQGYLIVDADGKRIDRAPGEIVSDPRRPDRLVENGLSCLGCHVQGIIPKEDQVREHLRKNARAFAADLRDEILGLYVPARRWRALIREDNERFGAALAQLGVPTGEPEPILTAVLRYEEVIDLRRASEELGCTSAELTARLARSPELTRALGSLLVRGGVQRQVFEELYPRLLALVPNRPADSATVTATGPFKGHADTIRALAWASSGRWFASGDAAGRIRLTERTTGRSRELTGHTDEVRALAFSNDGSRLLSGGADRLVLVWEVESGNRLARLVGHTAGVRSVAVWGDWAVSAGEDRTLRIWDVAGARQKGSLSGHTSTVTALAISADGKQILSGSIDRTARLWRVDRPGPIARFDHLGEVHAVAFSPDGRRIATGGSDRTVTIHDLGTREVRHRLAALPGTILALTFAADSRDLFSVTAADASEVPFRCHDVGTGRLRGKGGKGPIEVATSNREGRVLVGRGREIHLGTISR